MIIQKSLQQPKLRQTHQIQRSGSSAFYLPKSLDTRNITSVDKELEKRKSYSILDAKKIKSRIAQIFKSDQIRKSQSAMYSTHAQAKNAQRKKAKDIAKLGVQKKKIRDIYNRRVLNQQKMSIISNNPKEEGQTPAFRVQEIKVKKKMIIPSITDSSQQLKKKIQDVHNTYKILNVSKNKVIYDHFYRKPSLPIQDINMQQKVANNFLKTRKYFKPKASKEIGFYDQLEPWSKIEDQQIFPDFQ